MSTFLDCGCCINDDGRRVWCPTCEAKASGTVPCPTLADDLAEARAERDAAIARAEKAESLLAQWQSQAEDERWALAERAYHAGISVDCHMMPDISAIFADFRASIEKEGE